jgi:cold shock CspA family protein
VRLQGKITDWRADRGFGFITPNGGGKNVFLHISAIRRDSGRPVVGDIVTYVVAQGPKGPKADDVAIVRIERESSRSEGSSWGGAIRLAISLGFAVFVGVMGFNAYKRAQLASQPAISPEQTTTVSKPQPSGAQPLSRQLDTGTASSRFKCDGRTHCSQMTSCDEAKFFLNNCPGTNMDGNRDGVPCEKQWCRQ